MSAVIPSDSAFADINLDLHSVVTQHDVLDGDFGGRARQDFIPDRQIAQLRIPPHSIEAESSVLGACCSTMALGTGWGICSRTTISTAMSTD